MKELGKVLYFIVPYLDYLPRTEAHKKIAKLNNLYDEIIENKRKSMMKSGELDEKVNNNSADLLENMIYHASKDPENPTLTNEELRVRIVIYEIYSINLKFIKIIIFLFIIV